MKFSVSNKPTNGTIKLFSTESLTSYNNDEDEGTVRGRFDRRTPYKSG